MITRNVQILKISQAHLAPGMSENRLKAILAAHVGFGTEVMED